MSERYVDVPPGAVYLEKGNTFWQILLQGSTVFVTTGAVGTSGKRTKKTFKDDRRAREELFQRIDEMAANGYGFVLEGKPPRTAPVRAFDEEQEARIAEDPSDDALAVYADWLQERGDVRGELAALQLRATAKPNDRKLAKAIAEMLWEYRAHFYGPLALLRSREPADDVLVASWRAGWLDSLTLSATTGWAGKIGPNRDVAVLVGRLPDVVSAKFLRELVIGRPLYRTPYDFAPTVSALVNVLPSLPALRRLTIGEFTSDDCELSWSHMGSLAKLWKHASALEYVKLRAGSMALGKIDLPACREFRIETGGLAKESLRAVAEASWPALETLSLWFGKREYGGTCKVTGVASILDGKQIPKLRHLGLKNSQFGNELFAAVARSKILRRLETLDLSMSHITTDALERDVMPHAKAFAHLKRLDLSRCLLDAKGMRLAKTLAKHVEFEYQRDRADTMDDDPEYRYAAVGE